jgi:hypothetical protein
MEIQLIAIKLEHDALPGANKQQHPADISGNALRD